MNTQKFIISGIAGGVASFFAGYLIYDFLLKDFFMSNAGTRPDVMRTDADMIWWSLIVGSIFMGLLLSYIFNKWANIITWSQGVVAGAIIMFLVAANHNLVMYATTKISTLTVCIADIFAMAAMGAIAGAVVGLVNGMGKKA